MPSIIIKDYNWHQSPEFVILNIPIRGHPKKVDLFVIDNYTKISFPPFILELFLWANVVEKESICTITDQEAILTLRKANIGLEWPTLEIQNIDNNFKQECRNQAFEQAQRIAETVKKLKTEKRQRLQREAVKEQINVNAAILNEIDAIRNTHRKEAMRDFEDWRLKAELPLLTSVQGVIQENRKAYKPPLKWFKDNNNTLKFRPMTSEEILENDAPLEEPERKINENAKKNDKRTVEKKMVEIQAEVKSLKEDDSFDDNSCSEDSESDYELRSGSSTGKIEGKSRPGLESVKAVIEGKLPKRNSIFEEPSISVPLPRKNGTINVTFSERTFPTPARESHHLEEQEWLQKQAEARRKIGFDTKDLRPEERDPQWLKDKGDEFFRVGNHLGAISAYSYGIQISDRMASLYANRSAVHYAMGNYCRCMEDCSKALELMEPKCESNRESRARCHARRGAALCKLSAPQHGIPELEAALKLTPDNESIKRDLLSAKRYFELEN
nr:PREDICTED: dyslexia susceptibility 1 candidate gene 1 protein homolog isoform X1 [Megachile rotundata]